MSETGEASQKANVTAKSLRLPPMLSFYAGMAEQQNREKQKAIYDAEAKFHARTWGVASSISQLDLAAMQAHPGWRETENEIIGYNGRIFTKIDGANWRELNVDSANTIVVCNIVFFKHDKRAHRTLQSIRKWFEKSHPERTERLKGGVES